MFEALNNFFKWQCINKEENDYKMYRYVVLKSEIR